MFDINDYINHDKLLKSESFEELQEIIAKAHRHMCYDWINSRIADLQYTASSNPILPWFEKLRDLMRKEIDSSF